jgi:hypothetical protein
MRALAIAPRAGLAFLVPVMPAVARAQAGTVGPAKCYSCHRELAKPVYEKFHKLALAQLEKPKAAAFAKALGQPDPHGPRCMECHSPAVAGPPAGVSCESCHGAGKEYREPHQEPAFYKQADRKGLRDLYNKPAAIAKVCVDCHVTPDKALAAAGHPTGADFDVGQSIAKIVHWPSADQGLSRPREYGPAFYEQVGDAARPLVKARAVAGAAAARPAPVAMPLSGDDRLFAEQVSPSRRPPPSIAEDRPTGFAEAALVPAAPAPSLPEPDARARGFAVLERLLKTRAHQLDLPPPAPPSEFRGADSELLRIQDEILALALEALRRRSSP